MLPAACVLRYDSRDSADQSRASLQTILPQLVAPAPAAETAPELPPPAAESWGGPTSESGPLHIEPRYDVPRQGEVPSQPPQVPQNTSEYPPPPQGYGDGDGYGQPQMMPPTAEPGMLLCHIVRDSVFGGILPAAATTGFPAVAAARLHRVLHSSRDALLLQLTVEGNPVGTSASLLLRNPRNKPGPEQPEDRAADHVRRQRLRLPRRAPAPSSSWRSITGSI